MATNELSMAKRFEERLQGIIDDMRDARVRCYEGTGGHYIQFGDGSVATEPDMEQFVTLDENDWLDFENAAEVTECDHITEDEQVTAVLKSS
jgi:hypothetical protein